MSDAKKLPPLKSLHSESSLIAEKLAKYSRLKNEDLVASLAPGKEGCLKTRRDGTILDGHHRVHILRARGFDVDSLPRDVLEKDER